MKYQFVLFSLLMSVQPLVLAADIYVAAASSLTFVLPEIVKSYHQQSTQTLKISFGSTRNLTYQIQRGAPFDIFLSADKAATLQLQVHHLLLDVPSTYALGQLCFYSSHLSVLKPIQQAVDLPPFLLKNNRLRIALANPELAPFGLAAKQTLQAIHFWEKSQNQLVLGENAAQAAHYVISGNVDGAFIPCAIAQTALFQEKGQFITISSSYYQPIEQTVAIMKKAHQGSVEFVQFLHSQPAQIILKKYSYKIP